MKRAMPKGQKASKSAPAMMHPMPDGSMMKGKMIMPNMPPKEMPTKAAPKRRK